MESERRDTLIRLPFRVKTHYLRLIRGCRYALPPATVCHAFSDDPAASMIS